MDNLCLVASAAFTTEKPPQEGITLPAVPAEGITGELADHGIRIS